LFNLDAQHPSWFIERAYGTIGSVSRDNARALEQLARAVRDSRKEAGLTQEGVAFEAGISVRHFQELESGRLNPSYLTLRSVAIALGTTLARMFKAAG
jgi:DNA-binding XRE family transcriptional regulator